MTWSDYKYVISVLELSAFDITEDQTNEVAYDFLSDHVVFTDQQIEQYAMMKGYD